MLPLELQAGSPEIEKEPYFYPGGSQVVDQLHLVLLYKCPDGLDLDDHAVLDQQVRIKIADHDIVIEDPDRDLACEANVCFPQFVSQRLLVDGLQKSGTKSSMDSHGAADDRSRQRFIVQAFFDRINKIYRIHTINNARAEKSTRISSGMLRNPVNPVNPVKRTGLGRATHLVSAHHFFREALAAGLQQVAPIIYLQGLLIREQTGARALDVNVYGIDERFWQIHRKTARAALQGHEALVGASLAGKLAVQTGDTLLLRLETQQGIPRESFYGRRENIGRTIRLDCTEILPAAELGESALRPSQGSVFSVFVPLSIVCQGFNFQF